MSLDSEVDLQIYFGEGPCLRVEAPFNHQWEARDGLLSDGEGSAAPPPGETAAQPNKKRPTNSHTRRRSLPALQAAKLREERHDRTELRSHLRSKLTVRR